MTGAEIWATIVTFAKMRTAVKRAKAYLAERKLKRAMQAARGGGE